MLTFDYDLIMVTIIIKYNLILAKMIADRLSVIVNMSGVVCHILSLLQLAES